MKVYIERNNLQLELIWYRKHFDFIHVYEATDSIQYRSPNAYVSISECLGRLAVQCTASFI